MPATSASRRSLRFRPLLAATAAWLCLGASGPASAFSELVVFGDSLSDNGNLYKLSGVASDLFPLPGLQAVPPWPYYDGRFSNGQVAPEYLSTLLGVPLKNFAVAGAATGATNPNFATLPSVPILDALKYTGLSTQVSNYTLALTLSGAHANSNALYMVWAGANDISHADNLQLTFSSVIATAVDNIAAAVTSLHSKQARNFLLPLLPDLGATPRALVMDAAKPGAASFLTYVSMQFNQALTNRFTQLAATWTDEHFYVYDTFNEQHRTMDLAEAAGMNVTDACFVNSPPSLCAAYGANHYFFDDIHPTTSTHLALAQGMAALVPEPATVLTMGLGVLALVGVAARRRRQA